MSIVRSYPRPQRVQCMINHYKTIQMLSRKINPVLKIQIQETNTIIIKRTSIEIARKLKTHNYPPQNDRDKTNEGTMSPKTILQCK